MYHRHSPKDVRVNRWMDTLAAIQEKKRKKKWIAILTSEQRYLVLTLIVGILGRVADALSSLMDFRGERRHFHSRMLWYFALLLLGIEVVLLNEVVGS